MRIYYHVHTLENNGCVISLSAGSPMCAHSRVCAACHVLWNLVYVGAGIVQLVAGIFFLISLPIFKMGSNIWAGAWVRKWTFTSL